MKLSTLLEMHRCYALLRKAERSNTQLQGADYLAVLYAESAFDRELTEIIEPQEVEVQK